MWPTEGSPQPFRLTNSQINNFLSHKVRAPGFRGVFACDKMPNKLLDNQSMILNTDPHFKTGKHYVAIVKKSGNYLYFDPLCLERKHFFPRLTRELTARKLNNKLINVLQSPIQHEFSTYCGLFCIDYVMTATFENYAASGYWQNPTKLHLNDKICLENVSGNSRVQ